MVQKKRGLGKGLSDLGLNELLNNLNQSIAAERDMVVNADELVLLPVGDIQPGRYQPRRIMSEEALEELAGSIRSQGIIQPIVVRKIDDSFEIVAGERRWRAAQKAGLTEVPAIVRDIDDRATIAISLIENIQRQDLNVMEEAEALKRLIDEFELTHLEVSNIVGKSRASVSNLLRLLGLNIEVRKMVEDNLLDMGHARALLALEGEEQTQVAKQVIANELSVRETENLIRRVQNPAVKDNEKVTRYTDPNVQELIRNLSDRLSAKVNIQHTHTGKGKLVIYYNSNDELDGLIERIN